MKKKDLKLPMGKYASKRNAEIAAPAATMHEARYDMDTMLRAEEIRGDKVRHRAMKKHAKQHIKHITKIIKGGKTKTPAKVKEA